MNAKSFSHIRNNQPAMVDISAKAVSYRTAEAVARVRMPLWLSDHFHDGDFVVKKGPVVATAIIAGTQAAKNTAHLIPFCHALLLQHIGITVSVTAPGEVSIVCVAKTQGATGVEMEALVGASIAALTLYDMCKSQSLDLVIHETRLVKKTGGKSDYCVTSR